ncbi:hypothetical protein NTE_02576 [Candidatus Nitrososphaera evergladensis SR1]|uniref:Uncharacterized protein n=1 Tax=Candidatus Nitrososphaera evergladensis SR1 TaxID=1459636 RepID=A0A075MTV6_9ARCH|nr:hypothetical protein [Candidatus Nitrososphaera evergladensis]AIF84620.1 hypothetical protein NTE_02576 [Candidatus Nitrososphaera evergladensis SR1]
MLAHELYLRNRSFKGEFVKSPKPVKKVIMRGMSPTLDKKTLQEYGEPLEEYKSFQVLFSMPSNTAPRLGLRFRTTSPNSPRPYVELYGQFQHIKAGPIISLEMGKGAASFIAELNLKTKKERIVAKNSIFLNIDKERYFISGKNLYDEYVRSRVITKDSKFSSTLFKRICQVFFKHVRSRWQEDRIQNKVVNFSLLVLPKDGEVEYRSTDEESDAGQSFTDSFGNKTKSFAKETTITAKFLSYDDPAFAINCSDGERFYRNLSIGTESHRLVNINTIDVFRIAGLQWMFTNTAKPSYHFNNTKNGIYYQLWRNYKDLDKESHRQEGRSNLKVLCYLTSQAKMEVMLDENLTMEDMKEIFARIEDGSHIPFHALEVLIETRGKTTIWTHYLSAVRSLLAKKKIDKHYLLSRFVLQLRENMFNWLDKKVREEPMQFFSKSDFCIKVLCKDVQRNEGKGYLMDDNEEYAHKVGVIAAEYIKFKENVEESSNSLRDILAYSRYDREKLRFVMQRIGLGLSLSKAPEDKIKKMESFIRSNQPSAEISDDSAYNDYSYFFYKGYFSKDVGMKKEAQT